MRVNCCTITGIDDGTDLDRVVELSQRYPFAEWGVLFSKSKQGQKRYPSPEFQQELIKRIGENYTLHISVHLCGEWVTDLVNGDFSFARENEIIYRALRMQLNMTDDRFMSLDLKKLAATFEQAIADDTKLYLTWPISIILQTKRAFERAEEVAYFQQSLDYRRIMDFCMLYDVSGGRGKSPANWVPPVNSVYCGYAGGLGPENLSSELEALSKVVGNGPIWIDMESKVRDEQDRFDLDRVEACLQAVYPWTAYYVPMETRIKELSSELKQIFHPRRVKICIDGDQQLLNQLKDEKVPCMVEKSAWSDFEINLDIF